MDILIYAQYITNSTGKKERTVRKVIAAIHSKYNKNPGGLITIYECCNSTNLNEECMQFH